jgi:hypothetical protein
LWMAPNLWHFFGAVYVKSHNKKPANIGKITESRFKIGPQKFIFGGPRVGHSWLNFFFWQFYNLPYHIFYVAIEIKLFFNHFLYQNSINQF